MVPHKLRMIRNYFNCYELVMLDQNGRRKVKITEFHVNLT